MNDVIKVHSHPRSGTHFLMSFLYRNFYRGRNLGVLMKPTMAGHWSRQRNGESQSFVLDGKKFTEERFEIPYAALFGSHALEPQGSKSHAIYILRDGRDVALSLWAWKGMRPKESEDMSFSEYVRTKLDWQGAPGGRALPTETLFEHWMRHVEGYRRAGYFIVRYEELCLDPATVIDSIAEQFALKAVGELDAAEDQVGWNPGSGGVMKWKDRVGREDLKFFDSIVPRDFIGRYEPA